MWNLSNRIAAWGGVAVRRVAERLPHVHHRQTDAPRLLRAEEAVELVQARLRSISAAEPDRPLAHEVADDDARRVALADRDLVDAEGLRRRRADAAQLLAHVVFVEFLDRLPVKIQLLGHILDRARAAAPPDIEREALRVEGVVGQEVQLLALHGLASPAGHPSYLELEVDAHLAVGQIAHPTQPSVVPREVDRPTCSTERFFSRRVRRMRRACESRNSPWMVCRGRKPGNLYVSVSRRGGRSLAIRQSCQKFRPPSGRYHVR